MDNEVEFHLCNTCATIRPTVYSRLLMEIFYFVKLFCVSVGHHGLRIQDLCSGIDRMNHASVQAVGELANDLLHA